MSWGIHGLQSNARVIEAVDGPAFFEYIKTHMAIATTPSRVLRGLPS
jgi:purine nucleosidase